MPYVIGVEGRERRDLSAFAAASLLAAALVAITRASVPFDHGIWVIAYVFLVGSLAQFFLGRGQAALLSGAGRATAPRRTRRAQLVLWNIGVVAVPFGVLAEARLAVVLGSLSLLVALVSFSGSVRTVLASRRAGDWVAGAYLALLAFMAASVLVGTALAWDIDWL